MSMQVCVFSLLASVLLAAVKLQTVDSAGTATMQRTDGPPGHQNQRRILLEGLQTDGCHHLASFNKLLQIGETDGCLSANSVWHYLDDLQVKHPECRVKIQNLLAEKYQTSQSQDADDCECKARRPLVNHEIHRMRNGSYSVCRSYGHGSTYNDITNDLFDNIQTSGCLNHNYLWQKLQGIHNSYFLHHQTDCTQDLIVRAAIQYPTDTADPCICSKKTTTAPSTTTTTTTTTTMRTTTTTTTRATQPTPPPNKYTCNKFAVVEDIAMAVHIAHPNSSPCDQNAGGFDDALVLSTCNTSSPNTWRQGASVVADCRSGTHSITPFTPISTFNHGYYSAGIAKSGVFLECKNKFIKMVIQNCNSTPEIIQIDTGNLFNSEMASFVIV